MLECSNARIVSGSSRSLADHGVLRTCAWVRAAARLRHRLTVLHIAAAIGHPKFDVPRDSHLGWS